MQLSWLSQQSSVWIVLILFGVMMATSEIAYQVVRRHRDAATAMATVGISAGRCNHRSTLARVLLGILVCGTIYIVLDLDRPLHGLTRVDQGPMLRVKQVLEQDADLAR
jgi:hypothetical protein